MQRSIADIVAGYERDAPLAALDGLVDDASLLVRKSREDVVDLAPSGKIASDAETKSWKVVRRKGIDDVLQPIVSTRAAVRPNSQRPRREIDVVDNHQHFLRGQVGGLLAQGGIEQLQGLQDSPLRADADTEPRKTWWHKRTTLLFTAWLIIAVCVPLATRFRRGGGIGYMFALGVAIGFVFFVLDGISVTLGEIGLMPPALAAWLPSLILASVAAALTVRAEAIA